jgi:outer membrane protein OmpA-like peptidoglycan-associated protein
MKMMSEFNRSRWRNVLLAVTAMLATAGVALPQQSTNVAHPPGDEGEYSTWTVGPFIGTQWFQLYQETQNQLHLLQPKTIIGVRATFDIGKYFGFEDVFSTGFNRLELLPYGGRAYASVSEYNYQLAVHGLMYLTPRTAQFRPFLDFGPTGVFYQPSQASSLQQPAIGIPAIQPPFLRTKAVPGFDYGLGFKMNLTHRWEVRVDLMGLWTPTPDFGLPNAPSGLGSLWINTKRGENAWQFTTEIGYRGGFHEPAPPPAPAPPPPPPPPPPTNITVGAITGAHDVCPGDNIRLQVTASGWLPNQTPTYQWYVNNQPAPGGTGADFNLPTATGSGNQAVRVTVSAGGVTGTSSTVNVLIRPLGPPTVQFTVSPTTINYGDRLPLNATAMVSACAMATPIRYTASEGSITGTTFDSSGVSFDPNATGMQSKVVRLTATETDSRNQTASATANVTVNKKPVASRQDIVFANRSSRVNNAAKRYLIEQLTPKLRADPGSTVILIGHRDMSETGRAFATLGMQRVLNTAAVLSAGKGVCPSLDLSRVQIVDAGEDQTDPPMPFGDASVKERRGQAATDQRAQYRRVEVWFIPSGADRPAVSGAQPAPEREIKAKGCPR